mmetsp:Transcript_29421/g.61383  ORF Transcript_29421/g.61383 Transcript_29421/m.61383 type:complete len:227 (+) Transcript_29421:550-1230(+)
MSAFLSSISLSCSSFWAFHVRHFSCNAAFSAFLLAMSISCTLMRARSSCLASSFAASINSAELDSSLLFSHFPSAISCRMSTCFWSILIASSYTPISCWYFKTLVLHSSWYLDTWLQHVSLTWAISSSMLFLVSSLLFFSSFIFSSKIFLCSSISSLRVFISPSSFNLRVWPSAVKSLSAFCCASVRCFTFSFSFSSSSKTDLSFLSAFVISSSKPARALAILSLS